MRGASSINASSQPLFVVDGIPLSNANTTEKGTIDAGVGGQHVFWFGIPADPGKTNGSLFLVRGVNHKSYARTVRGDEMVYDYSKIGTFDLVLVSSSYRYNDDHYVEDILTKQIIIPDTIQ